VQTSLRWSGGGVTPRLRTSRMDLATEERCSPSRQLRHEARLNHDGNAPFHYAQKSSGAKEIKKKSTKACTSPVECPDIYGRLCCSGCSTASNQKTKAPSFRCEQTQVQVFYLGCGKHPNTTRTIFLWICPSGTEKRINFVHHGLPAHPA
jgi:hypothetical protein